jgi:2-oxoisovalerate dehydrogenase E2 component (dihydrolipoyl transacylase)
VDSITTEVNDSKSTLDSSAQQKPQSLGTISSQPPLPLVGDGDFEATPAVRHLLKRHNINVTDVRGTGKRGRVTKEDVERYLADSREETPASAPPVVEQAASSTTERDATVRLSPTENQMFKAMTRSLSIPHFLYTHSVNVSAFNELRSKLVTSKVLDYLVASKDDSSTAPKLTLLPFVMKALSRVFLQFPKLNSHLEANEANNPKLTLKASHNFGMAIDTPQGLLVPVIKNVQNHSVLSLAAEIKRISEIARAGKLKPDDFQGATFTVSNIGSVGAGCQAVSPVIVAPMVGILGMGRISDVPVFGKDDTGIERLVKERQVILSWSADHRIIDGATVAKAADMLAALLSRPESLGLILK